MVRTYKPTGKKRGVPTRGVPLTDRQIVQLLGRTVLNEEQMLKLIQEACRRTSIKRVADTLGIGKSTLTGVLGKTNQSHVTEHMANYMGYRRERAIVYRYIRRENTMVKR